MQKIWTDKEDFFNSKKSRNEANTEVGKYNCGGYALRTFSWYTPYGDKSCNYDCAQDLLEQGYEILEIMDILLQNNIETMLEDFGETLRVVDCGYEYDLADGEELIAYRIAVECYYDNEECYIDDIDFHFVVLRDGQWMEKMGASNIRKFEYSEEPWFNDYFYYNSEIVYLVHKI